MLTDSMVTSWHLSHRSPTSAFTTSTWRTQPFATPLRMMAFWAPFAHSFW
jgi:hypothetical protein